MPSILTLSNGKELKIEFRTITKTLSPHQRRPPAIKKLPIKAITTAVVIQEKYMGIGHSICSEADHYMRRDGMRRAFLRAVDDCGAWRDIKEMATEAYDKVWPVPSRFTTKRQKLSEEDRQRKIEAGSEKRLQRRGIKVNKA